MENTQLCQSCSMPIDHPELAGTERDGSPSKEYCKYCYQQGAFTAPGLTMEEMQANITRQMAKRNLPAETTRLALNVLPRLKRWRNGGRP
ncbi:zinc ribbon domain-containing protein [Chitinophaga sedimenti]|uniref:zinc ribbon domain-containing protein n=1 Tax=Chitinophaga sedimenti TaxID=2033606 RepID=UPI002003A387|nr:zinc ribbon domain-containing protein [Chitinophaga sedimenti]MCK7557135.1 zinc ribbon domain-containing protein [Chitinophaga sedimenti]